MAERCKYSCDSSSADSCEQRRPKLTSQEKANNWFMKASRVVWLGVNLRAESLRIWTRYMDGMGNEIGSIYNDKYFEIWTFYT